MVYLQGEAVTLPTCLGLRLHKLSTAGFGPSTVELRTGKQPSGVENVNSVVHAISMFYTEPQNN